VTGTFAELGGVPVKLLNCGPGAVLAGTICAFAYLILPPNSLAGSCVHVVGRDAGRSTASDGVAAKLVIHAASKKVPVATARWRSRPRIDIVFLPVSMRGRGHVCAILFARMTAHRAYRRCEFFSKPRCADDDQIPAALPSIPENFPARVARRPNVGCRFPLICHCMIGASGAHDITLRCPETIRTRRMRKHAS